VSLGVERAEFCLELFPLAIDFGGGDVRRTIIIELTLVCLDDEDALALDLAQLQATEPALLRGRDWNEVEVRVWRC